MERYADSLFIVLKTLWYVDEEDAVETGEISLFVGHKFVVTVRHGSGGGLKDARHRLEGMSNVLAHGPSAVVYAVCDAVVDRYEEVAESLQEDVDEVETSVFSTERTNDSARIYVLKRELAEMRRAVMPLREPMNRFTAGSVTRHPQRRRRRTSATSPTTSPAWRRRSTASTRCCPPPSRPTSRRSRSSRTTTCAGSPRRSGIVVAPDRWSAASTA